jgi:hypothetical protein
MKQKGDLADVFGSLAFIFEISDINSRPLPMRKAGVFGVLHVTKLRLDEVGHRTLRISSRVRQLRDVDSRDFALGHFATTAARRWTGRIRGFVGHGFAPALRGVEDQAVGAHRIE